MKAMLLLPLVVTLASVHAGFLNGGHFHPATNVVASRTIVGGAVGGGPASGAVSAAQYTQTVAAPATVHTVITSHSGNNIAGYPGGGSGGGGSGGGSAGQNNGGSGSYGTHGSYVYNSGPSGGGNTQGSSGGAGGYGGQGGSSGGGSNSGYGQPQSSYYSHQRYY